MKSYLLKDVAVAENSGDCSCVGFWLISSARHHSTLDDYRTSTAVVAKPHCSLQYSSTFRSARTFMEFASSMSAMK